MSFDWEYQVSRATSWTSVYAKFDRTLLAFVRRARFATIWFTALLFYVVYFALAMSIRKRKINLWQTKSRIL
jgi:hypothetical protein